MGAGRAETGPVVKTWRSSHGHVRGRSPPSPPHRAADGHPSARGPARHCDPRRRRRPLSRGDAPLAVVRRLERRHGPRARPAGRGGRQRGARRRQLVEPRNRRAGTLVGVVPREARSLHGWLRDPRPEGHRDALGEPVLGLLRARQPEAGLRRRVVAARGDELPAGRFRRLRPGRRVPHGPLRDEARGARDLERAEPERVLERARQGGAVRRARQGDVPGRQARRPGRARPRGRDGVRRPSLPRAALRAGNRRLLRRDLAAPLQRGACARRSLAARVAQDHLPARDRVDPRRAASRRRLDPAVADRVRLDLGDRQ